MGRRSGSALRVLREVVIFLFLGGAARRNQAVTARVFGVSDVQELALNHAKQIVPLLTIVLALVDDGNRERIGKGSLCRVECDAMVPVILAGLCCMLFEIVIDHTTVKQ
jgi:hypothetical protein